MLLKSLGRLIFAHYFFCCSHASTSNDVLDCFNAIPADLKLMVLSHMAQGPMPIISSPREAETEGSQFEPNLGTE